jgi:hypothetical protein
MSSADDGVRPPVPRATDDHMPATPRDLGIAPLVPSIAQLVVVLASCCSAVVR